MKMFKMILCCVIPTLLVISIILNILLLCGFEFTRNNPEPQEQSQIMMEPNEQNESEQSKIEYNFEQPDVDDTYSAPSSTNTSSDTNETVVYEDDNITVTYLTCEKDSDEIVHYFNIKNTSKKTLTVITSELYINGQRVYISGLTCEKLLPGTDSTEELVLLNSEWTQFTNNPSKLSFKIKLTNDKSRLDLYETDLITLIPNKVQ